MLDSVADQPTEDHCYLPPNRELQVLGFQEAPVRFNDIEHIAEDDLTVRETADCGSDNRQQEIKSTDVMN